MMVSRSTAWTARALRSAFKMRQQSSSFVTLANRGVFPPRQLSVYERAFRYMSSTTLALTITSTVTGGPPRPFFKALSEYSTTSSTATGADQSPEVLLYQYEVCPFCNKVRAYLDYHNVPYRVIEVDPLRKTELKHLPADYRKVPIAIVNGQQVNGSAEVIDTVHKLIHEQNPQQSADEERWLKWLDERLIRLIAPNIYRTAGESLQTFNYIADNAKFGAFQRATIRYTGAMAMYLVGRKKKKQYEIDDERAAIHAALRDWTDAIRDGGGKFLGGADAPSVADLSIYGVLKAIQTFDTFAELVEKNEELAQWYTRTEQAVGVSSLTSRE